MSNTIFFRVGTADRISLNTFIDSLRNFLGILRDFDTVLSEDRRGSIDWEVTVLQKSSPPVIGVTPSVRRLSKADLSEAVESQFIQNTQSLNSKGERNQYMPDSALFRLKAIARQTKKTGPMAVYVNGDRIERTETQISQVTLKNVRELTDVKFTGFGSIRGNLDSISVHKGDEFRVWDKISGKPVRCSFERDIEGRVKDCLRKQVLVSGIIKSNSAGLPIAMDVQDLNPAEAVSLPSLEQVSGLVDDFTEGKPLKQYIQDLSDE
jgi:hypothetical protein